MSVHLKPSAIKLRRILRDAGPRGCTTHEILEAGVGVRFGGRVRELREAGYEISASPIGSTTHSYLYVLVSSPEVGGECAAASTDREALDPPVRATEAVTLAPSTGPRCAVWDWDEAA